MASCQECVNYKSDHGPLRSSYCRAFGAKLNDSDNREGGQQFSQYWSMGSKATISCPHGRHSRDYD